MKLYYLALFFTFSFSIGSQQTDKKTIQEQVLSVVTPAKGVQQLISAYLYAWHFTKFCDVAILHDNLNCNLPHTMQPCTSYVSATQGTYTQIDKDNKDILKKDTRGAVLWSAKKARENAQWATKKNNTPVCFRYSKNKKYLACGYDDGSLDIFQDDALAQELSVNYAETPKLLPNNRVYACYFEHDNVLKAESHDHCLFAWQYCLKEFEEPIDISCAPVTDISCTLVPTSSTCTIL